ncbi:MAG: hypothetical protein EXR58_07630 [Chloroflexi bacterium]|nr:hypothetical protein [Chloroflexota bacterium]
MRELEEASPLVDARHSLFGTDDGIEQLPEFLRHRIETAGPYTLVVNLEGDPAAAQATRLVNAQFVVRATPDPDHPEHNPPQMGIDRLTYDRWDRPDLLDDYPELESQFIAEIYCRLARQQTDFARTETPVELPKGPIPAILFASGGRRSAKLWPAQYWTQVARWCLNSGLDVGLLGADPDRQTNEYHAGTTDEALIGAGATDLRGRLTLPQVAGALTRATALVAVDSALMHMGAAAGAQTIALFGASPRRLWAPTVPWVTVLEPDEPCFLCEENRFRNEACLLPVHQCMLSIAPDRVITELERILSR